MLLENKADVNAREETKKIPLHCAAWNNHKVVLQMLVDYGADVNARDQFGQLAKWPIQWRPLRLVMPMGAQRAGYREGWRLWEQNFIFSAAYRRLQLVFGSVLYVLGFPLTLKRADVVLAIPLHIAWFYLMSRMQWQVICLLRR